MGGHGDPVIVDLISQGQVQAAAGALFAGWMAWTGGVMYWQAKEAALRNWRKKMATAQEQESHHDFWDPPADSIGGSEKFSAAVDTPFAFSSVSTTAETTPRERADSSTERGLDY